MYFITECDKFMAKSKAEWKIMAIFVFLIIKETFMDNGFDYGLVPPKYAHCFNEACPYGKHCLRRLAAVHAPAGVEFVTCLNPAASPMGDTRCRHFRPADKIRLAWGVSRLCNEVPYGIARGLMTRVRHSFSKPTYYRILHQERPLSVEEQEKIAALFLREGVETAPLYDHYTENYDWKA